MMTLDKNTVRLVAESAAMLPVDSTEAVEEFYRRLFELAPDTRHLFKPDMTQQTQKLRHMLVWIVKHLEEPEVLLGALRDLGRRHAGYGVIIDYYAPVGSSMIWMLKHGLGERFTPEMEDAWVNFFAYISIEMEKGHRVVAQ